MSLIDTHAHIYEDVFAEGLSDVIERCISTGVEKILMPTTTIGDIEKAFTLKRKYNNLFEVMVGVHPNNVDDDYKKQIQIIKNYLKYDNFTAIGEVGLDFFESKVNKDLQIKMFNEEILIAKEYNLPLSIHVRNAFNDIYNILKNNQNGALKGVIHCFTGSIKEAKAYIDLGFMLGIGGIITFKNSNLQNVLENIDIKNIVLETDSPYLSPEPYRGKRNDPSKLVFIVEKLANIYKKDIHYIEHQTSENAKRTFNLS